MNYHYDGCPMFIYDESGNYITKTTITEFHANEMTVSIPKQTEGIERGANLSIMIVHSGGASEFNGIARDVIYDMREISLFKGQHRIGRKNSRFTINSPATVKSLNFKSNKIILPNPQEVCVVNMSKSGILIRSPIKFFNTGTVLEIVMNINENDVSLYAQAKRETHNQDGTFDYGCNFMSKR